MLCATADSEYSGKKFVFQSSRKNRPLRRRTRSMNPVMNPSARSTPGGNGAPGCSGK